MAYSGGPITNCDSPTIGNDKATFTEIFDLSMEVISEHDHTGGKGTQVPTAGIADGAITSAKIANLAVTTGLLAAGAVTTAKIASLAVTTGLLADASVTGAKIASATIGTGNIVAKAITTALMDDASVTAAKVAALAIGTANLIDYAVTHDKIGASNFIVSSSCGSYSSSSGTLVTVNSLSVDITVTAARIIEVGMTSDGSLAKFSVASGTAGRVRIYRDSTALQEFNIVPGYDFPPGMLRHTDFVNAGTYNYTIQVIRDSGSGTLDFSNIKLFAYEK